MSSSVQWDRKEVQDSNTHLSCDFIHEIQGGNLKYLFGITLASKKVEVKM